MRRQRAPIQGSRGQGAPTSATEDVLIRNYDFQWGYDVEIVAEAAADGTVFEKRYYLQPGGTRREVEVLEPGEYAVRVVLDGDRESAARCQVGDGPDESVLVELGNGAVSVNQGLYR